MLTSDRYKQIKEIHTSLFGQIVLCQDMETNQMVSIKIVNLNLVEARHSIQEDPLMELDVLSQVKALGGHSNVINLQSYFLSNDNRILHLVLDYCEGGDLLDSFDSIKEKMDANIGKGIATPAADEATVLRYLHDILKGLEFLHRNRIAHRDLSLENVLLKENRAVIADFGLCAVATENDTTFTCSDAVGKQFYMAPEVLAKANYDPMKADIWSLGISIFILLTSSPPFKIAAEEDQGFRFVSKNGIKAVFIAWSLESKVNLNTQDLLDKMLQVDPQKRIPLIDIFQHPALSSIVSSGTTNSAPAATTLSANFTLPSIAIRTSMAA